jgi:tetratricopeptide (TPR) repeat protein
METLDQVRKLQPVPPRSLQPTMPRDLETICLKCLQKDPRRRYATAGELAADLRRHLDGKPILARPVGRVERAWRWARRNPAWAAAIAGAAFLLFGWAATATAQYYEIRQAKRTSDQNREAAEVNERAAVKNAEEANQERDRATRNADAVREQFQESVSRIIGLAEKTRAKLQPAAGQKPDPRARAVEDLILLEARDSLTTLGKSTEAREQYAAGVQLTRDILLQEHPTPKGYGNLALMLNRLADAILEDDGDALAARELYREAVSVHQLSSEPADTLAQVEGQRMAGATYRVNLGRIARLLGDPAGAAGRFREAVDLRTTAANGLPGDPRLASYLAEAELLFGDAAWRAGDPVAAEEALPGRRTMRGTGRPTPGSEFKSDVVFASIFLGDMLLAAGRPQEAFTCYRKHLEPLQCAVTKSARPDFRAQHAQGGSRMCVALTALGKPDEAATEFRQSLKLWEELVATFPSQATYQSARALALARCGKTREAIDAADALLVRLPKHTEVRYQAALCFARCATNGGPDADRSAIRPVELLQAAAKEGRYDRRTLQTEPDLNPSRGARISRRWLQARPNSACCARNHARIRHRIATAEVVHDQDRDGRGSASTILLSSVRVAAR